MSWKAIKIVQLRLENRSVNSCQWASENSLLDYPTRRSTPQAHLGKNYNCVVPINLKLANGFLMATVAITLILKQINIKFWCESYELDDWICLNLKQTVWSLRREKDVKRLPMASSVWCSHRKRKRGETLLELCVHFLFTNNNQNLSESKRALVNNSTTRHLQLHQLIWNQMPKRTETLEIFIRWSTIQFSFFIELFHLSSKLWVENVKAHRPYKNIFLHSL